MMHKTFLIFLGAIAGAGLALLATQPHAMYLGSIAKAAPADTYHQLNLFGEVFERVRADYVEKPDDGKLVESAINGMLAGLDPHSSYMDPKGLRDMQVQTRGEFGGLGMEVTMEDGLVKVVAPIDDTPAAKAGVMANDIITHLDDEAVQGLTLNQAVEKMRGPVNTKIKLRIMRKGGDKPIEVTTRLVRDGLRIRVVEAEFVSGGVSMARASCQLLRKTQNPDGNVWSPPNWDVPKPDDIPKPTDPRLGMNGKWTTRPIVGAMGSLGPRRLWMSEVRELVEGTPMSPFVHVATGADFASPFANAGDQGLGYINSDVTLYLHRLPVTRWIGFDVVNHHASDGIAIGECWLYDEKGPIGTSTVAALAQRKPMTNVPPP